MQQNDDEGAFNIRISALSANLTFGYQLLQAATTSFFLLSSCLCQRVKRSRLSRWYRDNPMAVVLYETLPRLQPVISNRFATDEEADQVQSAPLWPFQDATSVLLFSRLGNGANVYMYGTC